MILLFPKEHGAYGQLFLPLLTALFLHGMPRLATLLLFLSASFLFWSHEPLLVLMGHRGTRAQREQGRMASGLFPLLLLGTLLGILGALFVRPQIGWTFLLPLAMGLCVVPFMLLRHEKSTLAELLVALSLSSWVVPLQVSKSVPLSLSLHLWTSLGFLFCVAVLSVRGLMNKIALGWSVGLALAGIALWAGLAQLWTLPRENIWPQIPTVALAIGLAAKKPGPRALRQVGWAIVAATVVQIGLLQLSR